MKPNKLSYNSVKYQRIDAALREDKRREWNRPVLWPAALGLALFAAGIVPAVIAYRRRERSAGLHRPASRA